MEKRRRRKVALTYKLASVHPTALDQMVWCSESHESGKQQLQGTCGEELGSFYLQGHCLGGGGGGKEGRKGERREEEGREGKEKKGSIIKLYVFQS